MAATKIQAVWKGYWVRSRNPLLIQLHPFALLMVKLSSSWLFANLSKTATLYSKCTNRVESYVPNQISDDNRHFYLYWSILYSLGSDLTSIG
jgi:hypothetical protein